MSTTYWNRNIPDEAHQKIVEFVANGHEIIWVAFPPAGGNRWSIITDKTFFNRNVPDECHKSMGDLHAAGHKLRCVAFPHGGSNSWSLVTDKTFVNRNIPDACHKTMSDLHAAGHKFRCIAFPPSGGDSWSVITDQTFVNRNIAAECHARMRDYHGRGQKVRLVAFPSAGGNRWSVLTDQGYFNRGVPDECHTILGELYNCHGPVRCLAYAPGSNNWSLASAAKPVVIYRLPFDDDKDWALWNGNWDDPVAGHSKGHQNGVQAFAYDFVHDSNKDGTGEGGQNIRAARAGKVVYVDESQTQNTWGLKPGDPGYGAPGGGNMVVIDHGDGTFAGYCHMQHNKVFVNKNEQVQRGKIIGLSGNTGHSSTAHLHFDVFKNWVNITSSLLSVRSYFEAKNHLCWVPRVGDGLSSNNS
jgi:hypothetical protein